MASLGVLHGLRVIELTGSLAGWSAGFHLRDAGADVTRVEAPAEDRAHDGVQFRVLNRGKQRVAMDVDVEGDRLRLHRLVEEADVLLHDLTPSAAAALGLDLETLAARAPALVVSAIGAWPQRHPWRDAPVRETLVLARLGILDEQPGHRPGPIFIRMPFANWIAGWLAAIAVVARLIARDRDGRGGAAHTSLAQAALVPMTMHWSRAETPTPAFAKGLDKTIPIPLHRCADGRWVHVHYSPDKAPWMARALADMGPDAVTRANAQWPPSHVAPNFGANRLIMATRPADEWVRHFWQYDVAAQIAAPFGEIYFDEQARVNGYVVEADDAVLGRTLVPGRSYTLAAPEASLHGKAGMGAAPCGLAPLHGLKVLDLGAYLAGPFACMLLADLGAEVIKVEPPEGDAMRRLERAFAGTQRGKRGLALRLGDAATRPVLDALARWADVVHHNVRMPAARKLGIDPQRLRAINPSLIVGHISSYGPMGPRADWPGFDQLMQASCGWEVESGGEGNPPMWLRFGVGDHLAALSCVFAMLLALLQRARTGEGQAVASSLLGAMALTASEVVARPDGEITPMAHLDAQQAGLAPGHRLYSCVDGWVAVAALLVHEQASFHAVTGESAEAWFAGRTVGDSLDELRHAGVPCEPALEDQRDRFLDDPRHEAMHTHYPHAVYGRLEQVGALWDFGDLPLRLDRAPPALGQHSREIVSELGLGHEDITRLQAQGLLRT